MDGYELRADGSRLSSAISGKADRATAVDARLRRELNESGAPHAITIPCFYPSAASCRSAR